MFDKSKINKMKAILVLFIVGTVSASEKVQEEDEIK